MLSTEMPVPPAAPGLAPRPAPRPVTPTPPGGRAPTKASIGVNVNLCDLVDEGFAVDDAFEVRDSDDVEGEDIWKRRCCVAVLTQPGPSLAWTEPC